MRRDWGRGGRKKDCTLTPVALTDAFVFPVAPATENSDWSTNNSCCQTNLKSNQLLYSFGCQSIASRNMMAFGHERK